MWKLGLKNVAKKTLIAIGCKRSGLISGADHGNRLRDENILGHGLVDGWTRWVACAYSGAGEKTNSKQQSIEGRRSMDFVTLMTLKLTGERDWH